MHYIKARDRKAHDRLLVRLLSDGRQPVGAGKHRLRQAAAVVPLLHRARDQIFSACSGSADADAVLLLLIFKLLLIIINYY